MSSEPETDYSLLLAYLGFLATEKSTVVRQMHNAFTWATAILTIVVSGILLRGEPPDLLSYIALVICLIFISFLFQRTCKDYANQMKLFFIEREVTLKLTKVLGGEEQASDSRPALWHYVDAYLLRWTSGLPPASVIQKVLFELNFFPLFVITLTLLAWHVVTVRPWEGIAWLISILATGLICVILAVSLMHHSLRCEVPYERGEDYA